MAVYDAAQHQKLMEQYGKAGKTNAELIQVKSRELKESVEKDKTKTRNILEEYADTKWIPAEDWVEYNKAAGGDSRYTSGRVSGGAGVGSLGDIIGGFTAAGDDTLGTIIGVGVLYMFLSMFRR